MRNSVDSLLLRAVTAAAICLSLTIYPALRLRAAMPAVLPYAAKTEAEFRSEAKSYQAAIKAIDGINSLKVDTPDGMKQALTILENSRSSMKFFRSNLVAQGLNDSTFVAAVKKAVPNQAAAETLLQNLIKDVNNVQKIDGSGSLVSRLQSTAEADSKILLAVSERIKNGADAIKKTAQHKTNSRSDAHHSPRRLSINPVLSLDGGADTVNAMLDPLTAIATVALIVGVIIVALFAARAVVNLWDNLFTAKGRDAVADCQSQADSRLLECNRVADQLTFPFNLSARAVCYSQWLIDQSQCLIKA
ncbi:MAG TPA: hypothetical protein VLA93_19770 [Pyrinomonadaceae bacterium]|nr:hypothetical protein [Pyrinomonadaceae bacterium]